LIIPQNCLRFNDIPNVGVTGRHGTNFVMIGQHSLYNGESGYWKDRCIELDFRLLTDALKIPEKDVTFVEDVWLGPNAFGYSLEYFVLGLELGNAVFTEFLGTPEKYTHMADKIVDMGAGLERFAWLSQGTPTCYDAIFGPVTEKLLSMTDYDRDFYMKYSKVAGALNLDEVPDITKAKKKISDGLGISVKELIRKTTPIEAAYAIADHSKTLLLSISDGALPSNVGGGYNLRIILRRALGFIQEYGFDVDLADICEWHADYLKKLNPRLVNSVEDIRKILDVEKQRFISTEKKNMEFVETLIEKKSKIETDKLVELYESRGITPEFVESVSKRKGIEMSMPQDFYEKISSKHMKEPRTQEAGINIDGLEPTELLFYKNRETGFTAKVTRIIEKKYVILDRTAFFGGSGGQEPDHGFINKCRVYGVEKMGNIIVHHVENPDFGVGDTVEGEIDEERRLQLTMNHTAVHIINGAARKVLGNHVWQAGAHKGVDKAHLDITHFNSLTQEEADKIENIANDIVKRSVKVVKTKVSRGDAEKMYGMRIYQGGVIPEKEINIIEIPGFDTEGCGGTHVDDTGEILKIAVLSTERIQDGVVRINIVSWKAAEKFSEEQKELLAEVEEILGANGEEAIEATKNLFARWKKSRKERKTKNVEDMKYKMVDNRLIEAVEFADTEKLRAISKSLSNDNTFIFLAGMSDKIYVFCSAGKNTGLDAGKIVFESCKILKGSGGGTGLVAQGFGIEIEKIEDVMEFVRRTACKKEKY
ncbi:MAG: alanine--tRNA ligase, partial [Candidatus Aenigmarchaeota archaeon]|nr:alanine--tRNA ligase [Candidatus Aenigmarchaeota archaeon]